MDPGALLRLREALADRYRFDREIGRGGWGTVWLAEDLVRRRPVAIKVMQVGASVLARRERFLREIELEARLVHPHIVPVHDSGEVDDAVWLAMPFVDGETLEQRLARDGALPIPEALRIARQVASALGHAHARRIVHRDVKPANILLQGDQALVADFGIARVLDARQEGEYRTTDVLAVGTPAYMAPEQANGSVGIDGRADLYALGCVLFEMLLGRVPFEGRDHGETIRRHLADPVPPLRGARDTVAPELERLVHRAMAKMPADRYPTAEALIEALDQAATARPRRRRAPWNRQPIVFAGLGAVTFFTATGLVARERRLDALVAQADSLRIVAFPLEDAGPADAAVDARLRRAVARWEDLTLADAFAVREAAGSRPLTTSTANRIALQLRSGRILRGSLRRAESGFELRLVLSATGRRPVVLREANRRVASEGAALDSALEQLLDELLVSGTMPAGLARGDLSTRSLSALNAYLEGRDAVARWALDTAASAFDRAVERDPRFGSAALWQALVRYWAGRPTSDWTLPVRAALADSVLMRSGEAGIARALETQVGPRRGGTCGDWDALTQRRPFDFVGWYGAALCRDRDDVLLPDLRSPTGLRFRSSYQTALLQYLQAYQRLPAMHRSLAADSYAPLRATLLVSGYNLRMGVSPDGRQMYAPPILAGDTIAYVPYPIERIVGGDPSTAGSAEGRRQLMRRQRELFRDIAGMWSTALRGTPEAREAQAIALQMLGDVTALDSLRRARDDLTSASGRLRLTGAEAWLRVGFAIPDDWASLRVARALADTVLARDTAAATLKARASLAALTGRWRTALQLTGGLASRLPGRWPESLREAVVDLQVSAAMGAPAAELGRREGRVDSLIVALVPEKDRPAVRGEAFGRAVRLAWWPSPLSDVATAAVTQDYLPVTLRAATRGDTTALAAGLVHLRALRRAVPPAFVSLDGLLPEAALLAATGDVPNAIAWLDERLAEVRTMEPDFDAIRAASLVRLMMLRAELAARVRDRTTARRWAGAVVALWERADPELQPTVESMRRLMR